MHPDPDAERQSTLRLLRIRIYLVDGGREVLAERRYVKTLNLDPDVRRDVEDYLNMFLEGVPVETRDERSPSDFRLELCDDVTDDLVLSWRYAPQSRGRWQC